jgi:hypothetical protein
MSVSSTAYTVQYTSNGVTTAYAIPYYFMAIADIYTQVIVSGVAITAVNGTDYVVSGTPDAYGAYNAGGTLTWQVGSQWSGPPPVGSVFTVIRMTARLQPDQYLDDSAFPATVNESDLDRLTLISQEASQGLSGFLGILAGPPASGTFSAGQWFITATFVSAGYFGYCCTVGGTPGTWKGFGVIAS